MIRFHHLPVTRTARFVTLGEPGPAVRQLWIACHGYGQLAAELAEGLRVLAAPERLVAAPEALSRFYVEDRIGPHGPDSRVGATWMTREDRLAEIDDYVAYLDRLLAHLRAGLAGPAPSGGLPRPRIFALGYSQGAATAARWAARTEAPLDELVLWGGRIPPELRLEEVAERWRALRVTLVAGTRDRWLAESALREDQARLLERGIAVRVRTFEGGHRLDDRTLGLLAEASGVGAG